ncbi:MAG: hypothetical protein ACR2QB_01880, partial [Gammaproteobacteria bacterium]
MSEKNDNQAISDPDKPAIPKGWGDSGMRPTLNGTGFMFEVLDEFADDYIQYAARLDTPVL